MRPNTPPTASQPPVMPASAPRPRAFRIVRRCKANRGLYSDMTINYTRKCRLTLMKCLVILPLVSGLWCSYLLTAPDGESRCGIKGKLPEAMCLERVP